MIKNIVVVVLTLTFVIGCSYNKRSKKYHTGTLFFCDAGLYIETYTASAEGGAIGGTIKSDYLTDSINFRVYVGSYDEGDGGYSYKCAGNNVTAIEIVGRSTNHNQEKSKKEFDIAALKKAKAFE